MTETRIYGVDDFMRAFGAHESERQIIADEASKYDFRYRRLAQDERDQVILSVLRKLENFTVVGAHRSGIWESCWSDTKKTFLDAQGDLNALDPGFMGGHPVVRLHGDYARPEDPKFLIHWARVRRSCVQRPSRVRTGWAGLAICFPTWRFSSNTDFFLRG